MRTGKKSTLTIDSRTTFPVEVRRGSVVVKVYLTPSKGRELYTISYYLHGKRHRPTFADLADAKREAENAATKIANGEANALTLRDEDKFVYLRAVEALRDTGVPFDVAAAQFAQAVQFTNGASLVEAAKFYRQHQAALAPAKLVSEVVDELLNAKRLVGRSPLYLTDLRLRLGRFAKAFQCPVTSISTSQLESFLISLKVRGRTRNNFRNAISTLLRFAKGRGYLPRNHLGVADIEKCTDIGGEVKVFTIDEMTALLRGARPELLPSLAVGAFAGLRSEEIRRLDWADINFDDGHIEIKASKAKTKVRRIVPLAENLRLWLIAHRRESGPVCPFANLCNQLLKRAKAAGVTWKRNGLRHSFISYRVAETQDVPRVSLEAGNSPGVIFTNYLKLVSPAEAERWFGISP